MIGFIVFLVALASANAQFPTDCGRSSVRQNLDPRIVGGKEATPHSWPWQLSLRANGRHICGASIVHASYAITAAHCTYGQHMSAFSLRAGRHTETGNDKNEQIGTPSKMWQHESYNSKTINNDITLFRLSKPYTFNSYVRPVCMPTSEITTSGVQLWATGWGQVQGTGSQGKLKQAMLPSVDRNTCNRNYYQGSITQAMVCAGQRPGDNICMGDSGGPLVYQRSGKYELVGASSWIGSSTCYQAGPGVFTNIHYFKSWVSTKVTQAEAEEELIAKRGFRPVPAGVAFRKYKGIEIEGDEDQEDQEDQTEPEIEAEPKPELEPDFDFEVVPVQE